ncbi:MAG: hypothetical protein MK089_08575 [Phycisphaerales bacterium]|nr:hypothetical protein [Phycisphaerales bacterium]
MNRIIRLVRTTTAPSGWKALSASTAIACGFGLTTIAMSTPATAQERTQEVRGAQFPTAESMKAGVATEVEQGNLTQEQADMILRVHARLLKGIESGAISNSKALGMLGEQSISIYQNGRMQEHIPSRSEARKTITKKDYDEAFEKMKGMVEAGEITREQMSQRLDRMKKAMAKTKTYTRQDYAKAQADMQKMVDEGKITEDQMKQRLSRMRQAIGRDKAQPKKEEATPRAQYDRMKQRLDMAVESGRLTQEEADKMLMDFRKELGRSRGR